MRIDKFIAVKVYRAAAFYDERAEYLIHALYGDLGHDDQRKVRCVERYIVVKDDILTVFKLRIYQQRYNAAALGGVCVLQRGQNREVFLILKLRLILLIIVFALGVRRRDEHREASYALKVILLRVAYAPVAVVHLRMRVDVHFQRGGDVFGACALNVDILGHDADSAGAVKALHRGVQNALIRRVSLLTGAVEIVAVFKLRADRCAGYCSVGGCTVYSAVARAVYDRAHIAAADYAAGV